MEDQRLAQSWQYLSKAKMRLTEILLYRKIAPMTLKHSNLPESYIRQCTEVILYKSPKLPNYRQITVKEHKNYYDLYKPWTREFQLLNNIPSIRKMKVWVEPVKEWMYFRGDRVEVLWGKDKGKQGIVSYVVEERNWVLVEGLNSYLKGIGERKTPVRREEPLLIERQVALVDPVDKKPTKVEWRYDEEGNRVRVSLRSGRIIPIPPLEAMTYDYTTKRAYVDSEKDTVNEELKKVTFVPQLKTFEMDIMDENGIEEDRIPAKTYWY